MDLTQKRTTTLPITIRDADPADVSFIFSSWLKSFRKGELCQGVDNAIYYSEHHKVIERILRRSTVKIACNPQDPSQIMGYLVYEKLDGIWVFHYCYVKHTFRNLGVARELARAAEHDFKTLAIASHKTYFAEKILSKYELIYHPYVLINYTNTDELANKSEVAKQSAAQHEAEKYAAGLDVGPDE